MLELKDIKALHEKAFIHNQTTREKAANDLVFYWITQWDDTILSDTQLLYKGEFNVLRKAGRQILSDLMANPVQIDFQPIGETEEDSKEIIDGLYRTDDAKNTSIEAYEVGSQESVVCGIGAWELYNAYESIRTGDNKQVIKRRPIHEANNVVFFDPQSKRLDRSDAKYVSVIHSYSAKGFEDLYEDLTGEAPHAGYASDFAFPEHSYTFPWRSGASEKIYIVDFYHKEKVRDKILTMTDPIGQTLVIKESSLADVMDDMLDAGYVVESSKDIMRWKITKYIVSGIKILDTKEFPGEYIPIVPIFGEHAVIEGEDHWEGVTRLAKDPSTLRNFAFSYLADILMRSPREKPIFFQEQIAGYENMYSLSGAENNYPYLLQNRMSGDGTELPIGPVAVMPAQGMPAPLPSIIELTKSAVEDVANPGLPQDIADPDSSGKAVLAVQARIEMQSLVYQEHLKHAKRYDALVYASMSAEILDVPKTVLLTRPDGSKKPTELMNAIIDKETGDIVIINDLTNSEFEVTSTIGPSYSSQKDQTIDRLLNLMTVVDRSDPVHSALVLKLLKIMDGVDFDDIREYANTRLVLMGIRKPETEEEIKAWEDQQKKGDQKPADLVLAEAEVLKGQADMLEAQNNVTKMQLEAQNEILKRKIDTFEAQTARLETQIKAIEAGANIQNKKVDSFGKDIDNQAKVIKLQQPKEPQLPLPEDMSDEELFAQLAV